ncbi:MAG TPA: hypothetical protein PK078_09900, partial [Anaerolineales bacterium]|nr:hypothetical protein [Anaerolineales bacterium]
PKGLDLSTFNAAIRGGEDGAVIQPGDAAGSLLIQIQSQDHFSNFSSAELNHVIDWINNGAPEN